MPHPAHRSPESRGMNRRFCHSWGMVPMMTPIAACFCGAFLERPPLRAYHTADTHFGAAGCSGQVFGQECPTGINPVHSGNCGNSMDNMVPFSTQETRDGAALRRVWLECGMLALLLALAAALRIPGLYQGFWGDEVYTLCGAMWPLDKLLSGKMAASTFTPLTWLLVKATIGLFPPAAQFRFPAQMPVTSEILPMHLNEVTLRLPFFFISLVTLVVLFFMVRRYFGLNAAFWAGLFLAVSPEHVWYSNELRFYGMVCLAGAMLLYGVQLVLDGRGWRGWVVTALGLLLGLPTHLSFFFVTAGIMAGAVISLLLESISWRRRIGVTIALAGLCIAVVILQVSVTVCFSPAPLDEMRLLFSGQKTVAAEGGAEADADTGAVAVGKVHEPPAEQYTLWVGDYFGSFIVQRFLSCFDIRCGIALTIVLAAGLAGMYARRRSLLLSLLGVFCSPLPLFFLHVNHKWLHRYFIFDILLCAVLAGVGMDTIFRGLRRLVGASRSRLGLAACAALVALVTLAYAPSLAVGMKKAPYAHVDGGMKNISEILAKRMSPTDRILFLEPYRAWRLSYHLIPYYLCRMRPDWRFHGVVNKMVLCADRKEFDKIIDEQPREGFWVVSFDGENRDASLNQVLKQAGGVVCAQYRYSSLWRIGGDAGQSGANRGSKNLLAEEPPAVEVPKEGSVVGAKVYGITLPKNDEKALKTPTVLFPVVRDEIGQPTNGLKANCSYTLRFRLQLQHVAQGSNRTRTFRVMLFAKEVTIDLMYAEGTTVGQDYAITFVPGEYLPETLSGVKIGFGIRGGTGAFCVDNVRLQAYSIPNR